MKTITYGSQSINNRDINYIKKSVTADKITTGNFVINFEKKLKKFSSAKYAISCSSGTAALHMAFYSIEVKPGDVLIVPSVNFISTCNILNFMNAKVYLCDVDSLTGQMTPELLLNCIKINKINKIKAIVTMYLGGHILNNIKFFHLKKKFKFLIIEDACHAFGSKYKLHKRIYPIGSCKHADISTFSFHPLKSITTAEGGALTTNNSKYAKRAVLFKSHGIERTKNHWSYQVSQSGLNYRLSDINCALGISQMNRIGLFLKKRDYLAKKYRKLLLPLKKKNLINYPDSTKEQISSNHLFIINIDFKKIGKNKNNFFKFMLKNNIICQFHYIPIYRFKQFKKLSKKLINTEKYYYSSVSLPIHFNLSSNQQNKVIKCLYKFFNKK